MCIHNVGFECKYYYFFFIYLFIFFFFQVKFSFFFSSEIISVYCMGKFS